MCVCGGGGGMETAASLRGNHFIGNQVTRRLDSSPGHLRHLCLEELVPLSIEIIENTVRNCLTLIKVQMFETEGCYVRFGTNCLTGKRKLILFSLLLCS